MGGLNFIVRDDHELWYSFRIHGAKKLRAVSVWTTIRTTLLRIQQNLLILTPAASDRLGRLRDYLLREPPKAVWYQGIWRNPILARRNEPGYGHNPPDASRPRDSKWAIRSVTSYVRNVEHMEGIQRLNGNRHGMMGQTPGPCLRYSLLHVRKTWYAWRVFELELHIYTSSKTHFSQYQRAVAKNTTLSASQGPECDLKDNVT